MYRLIRPGLLLLLMSAAQHSGCSVLLLHLSFHLYTIPGLVRSMAGSGVPEELSLRMLPGSPARIPPVKYHYYKSKPVAELCLHEYRYTPDPGP
ncbi:hypothetical protein D9M68_931910 [compost metagenome]